MPPSTNTSAPSANGMVIGEPVAGSVPAGTKPWGPPGGGGVAIDGSVDVGVVTLVPGVVVVLPGSVVVGVPGTVVTGGGVVVSGGARQSMSSALIR